MSTSYAAAAPAKLNLGLHVLRRRADGYHDLETVFLRIGWADRLRAAPAEGLRLTCSDPSLPTDEGNLCVRAALALAEAAGVPPHAALHLEKNVPYGAGLGGGSSDAATTMRLLTRLWAVPAAKKAWYPLAMRLGADVSFFTEDSAGHARYATGTGEILQNLHSDGDAAYRFPYALAVVMPPVHVATAEAYRRVTPCDTDRPDLRALVASNDLDRWRAELVNDFEAPIMDAYPLIGEARQGLDDAGAAYAAMTGSGAAVFGVFERPADAARAAHAARDRGWAAWQGHAAEAPIVHQEPGAHRGAV